MMRHIAAAAIAAVVVTSAQANELSPRRVDYRVVHGRALEAYVFSAPGDNSRARHGAILLFHPGGWVAGKAEWEFEAARRFAALGLTAMAVDYRLSDASATPIDSLADVCGAFTWMRNHAAAFHVDPDRIAGYGESAGGQLLAAAATGACKDFRPALAILVSPLVDLEGNDWFKQQLRGQGNVEDYSPIRHVDGQTPATLVVQGANDNVAPAAAATQFCTAMRSHRRICDVALYAGVGHLLTRNLQDQETIANIDPAALKDSQERMRRFLAAQGIIPAIEGTDLR